MKDEAVQIIAEECAQYEREEKNRDKGGFVRVLKEFLRGIGDSHEMYYAFIDGNWQQVLPADWKITRTITRDYTFSFTGKYYLLSTEKDQPLAKNWVDFITFRLVGDFLGRMDGGNMKRRIIFQAEAQDNPFGLTGEGIARLRKDEETFLEAFGLVYRAIQKQRQLNFDRFMSVESHHPKETPAGIRQEAPAEIHEHAADTHEGLQRDAENPKNDFQSALLQIKAEFDDNATGAYPDPAYASLEDMIRLILSSPPDERILFEIREIHDTRAQLVFKPEHHGWHCALYINHKITGSTLELDHWIFQLSPEVIEEIRMINSLKGQSLLTILKLFRTAANWVKNNR